MENAIGVAGIAGAIFVSFALALGLEYISLVALMRLMPARQAVPAVAPRLSPSADSRTRGFDRQAA